MNSPVADAQGFPPSCHVETAEGPVTMAETPNKGYAVLTRLPSGVLGFRQLIKLVRLGPVPLVRLILDRGQQVVLGRRHPVFRHGMRPVPAEELAPGDALETAFAYPPGYAPPDLADARLGGPIRVLRIESAGEGEVMRGTVRETHSLFVTAGILCGE